MRFKRIQIETTNFCNMKCDFCPNKRMTRERKILDFQYFKEIIDDIAENKMTGVISFAGNGEPFIDPDFLNKLKYCKSKNLKTAVTTNGLLIEKISEEFIRNRFFNILGQAIYCNLKHIMLK